MPEVTVLVDDALLGRLPDICARDGVPTADRLIVRSATGKAGMRTGTTLLLMLLGPIGWLSLWIRSKGRDPAESLAVHLPYSERAFERLVATRRNRDRWSAAAVASGAAGLVGLVVGVPATLCWMAVECLVISLVVAIVASSRLASMRVHPELDASGRWVTLSNVDDRFASAASEQTRIQRIRLGDPAAHP